jgi:hypothetical protein
LLLVAQVVRGSADGSDTSQAASQLPMLVDQIKAFENRIGLGRATAAQIGRALEHYEMLTEQELALWTRDLKRGAEGKLITVADSPTGEKRETVGLTHPNPLASLAQ